MPDNSDVQSRYMQGAEAYAIKKKTKLADGSKVFRMKRDTLEARQAQQAIDTLRRDKNASANIARGDRVEKNLKEWMNATRRHENIAEYSDAVCTNSNGANRANTSAHVNLEWIAKLRSKKGERRKNNTHIHAPVRFQDTNQEDKKSQNSTKALNREYSDKDIPKVYYKKDKR